MRPHIFDIYGYDRHAEDLDFYDWLAKEAGVSREVAKTLVLATAYEASDSNIVRTLFVTEEDLASFRSRFGKQ